MSNTRVLDELRSVVTAQRKIAPDSTSDLAEISARLASFGSAGVARTIAGMQVDSEALAIVARRSYLHGNGFYKVVLLSEAAFTVRLHIWFPEVQAEENLHSHRWPFVSTVLQGVLRSEIWEDAIDTDSRSYDEYLYFGKDERFLRVGPARVRLRECTALSAGTTYATSADTLHRIIGREPGTTATLFWRPAECRAWSRNIIVNERLPNARPTYLKPPELQAVLTRFIRGLAASDPG